MGGQILAGDDAAGSVAGHVCEVEPVWRAMKRTGGDAQWRGRAAGGLAWRGGAVVRGGRCRRRGVGGGSAAASEGP